MPTNTYTVGETFKTDLQVFVSREPEFRLGGTLDITKIGVGLDLVKRLTSGDILTKMVSGLIRVFPRTKVKTAVTTGAAIVVSNPRAFVVGEVLTVSSPTARILLGGTYVNGETLTFTLAGGSNIVHTVANYTNVTALAADVTTTLNASPLFGGRAIAYAENGYLHLYAKDMVTPYVFTAAESAAAGTITVLNAATNLASGFAVGTILSVNVDTATITLAAGSASRLPVGASIGVDVTPNLLGIVATAKNLVEDTNDVVGESVGVINGAAMSYWDGQVAALLPQIRVL